MIAIGLVLVCLLFLIVSLIKRGKKRCRPEAPENASEPVIEPEEPEQLGPDVPAAQSDQEPPVTDGTADNLTNPLETKNTDQLASADD